MHIINFEQLQKQQKMLSRCLKLGSGSIRKLLSAPTTSAVSVRQAHVATRMVLQRDVAEYFHFEQAIVGSLTQSFVEKSLRYKEPNEPINLEKAKRQHAVYVSELKKLIPDVVQIPPDDRFPDLVFVEDPTFILEGTALLALMKPLSRAGEIEPMRPVLEGMGFRVLQMREEGAYLDAGDILFTGRELLVGLTERTNQKGIEELARAFPDWPVTGITVQRGVLHLKSMCSIAGIDLLAISGSEAGRIAWREIETKAHYKYDKLVFPDNNGANCLFVNGVVLHPPKEEYPESFKIWETLDCPRVAVPNSEMAKADGSLTCNSIRIFP